MKITTYLLPVTILLSACGGESNSTASAAAAGTFKGQVGDKQYDLQVRCRNLEEDYFQFLSDNNDYTDTNGDGLNISGMQNGDSFIFTVIDNGVTFSAPGLERFEKTANGASGSGKLWEDGGTSTAEGSFTVDCG